MQAQPLGGATSVVAPDDKLREGVALVSLPPTPHSQAAASLLPPSLIHQVMA